LIFDSLKDTEPVEKLHPLFKKAFDSLKTVDLDAVPAGLSFSFREMYMHPELGLKLLKRLL
jgi:hypothetical protein